MKKDRERCSELGTLGKPQRETMFTENECPHLKFSQVLRPDYIICSRCESVRSELPTQLKIVKSIKTVILRSLRRRIGLDWCVGLKRFFPTRDSFRSGRSSLRMTCTRLLPPKEGGQVITFYETIIYSLVRSSDLTVLLTADAKASGVRSRRNLNNLRVVLNKPSGGKTSSGRLENYVKQIDFKKIIMKLKKGGK